MVRHRGKQREVFYPLEYVLSSLCVAMQVYGDSDFCGTAKGEWECISNTSSSAESDHGDVQKVATFFVTLPDADQGYSECRLRFVSLTSPKRVRLFSLFFSLIEAPADSGPVGQGGIDMPSVERWLGRLNTPNNSRAQSLMDSVRQFQANQTSATAELRDMAERHGSAVPGLTGLLQFLPQFSQRSGDGDRPPLPSTSAGQAMFEQFLPVLQAARESREEREKSTTSLPERTSGESPTSTPSKSTEDTHVGNESAALEERLKVHIDQRIDSMEKRMTDRLDRIEQLLTSCLTAVSTVAKQRSNDELSAMPSMGSAMFMHGLAGMMQLSMSGRESCARLVSGVANQQPNGQSDAQT